MWGCSRPLSPRSAILRGTQAPGAGRAAPCPGEVSLALVLTAAGGPQPSSMNPYTFKGKSRLRSGQFSARVVRVGGVRSLAEFGFVPQTRLLMHRRLVLRGSHQRNPTGQPIAMARASPCWSGGGPTTHVCLHSAAGGAQAPLQGRVLLLSHAWGLTHVQACGGASAVAGLAELSDLPQGRGRGGVGVGLGAGLKSFGPWAFTASCLDGGCSEGLLHCGRAVSGVSIWDCERL